MVTASAAMGGQRESVAAAIGTELERQGVQGVDVEALTEAVEAAIASQAPISEGRHPDELNSSNDD